MLYDDLVNGLKMRGFTGIEEMCSMGRCHKDEKHYILLTDGLVIYSNVPFWTSVKHLPDGLEEIWCLEKMDELDTTPEFSFQELDEIMNI